MSHALTRILAFSLLLGGLPMLPKAGAQQAPSTGSPPAPVSVPWHYGGFVDFGYLYDPNSPSNHLFRDRGTTPVVDQPNIDMADLYLKKDASEQSRWGMEATLQAGKDSEAFGFSATAPNLPGSKWLRHLGPTDVSYLAPVGSGLTVQAGIFSSLIGYDSLYAKDNNTLDTAFNTLKSKIRLLCQRVQMGQIIDRLRAAAEEAPDSALAHISPLMFGHNCACRAATLAPRATQACGAYAKM
jgi:Putative beta-barrel porin-2, OmpL-like. bbp2